MWNTLVSNDAMPCKWNKDITTSPRDESVPCMCLVILAKIDFSFPTQTFLHTHEQSSKHNPAFCIILPSTRDKCCSLCGYIVGHTGGLMLRYLWGFEDAYRLLNSTSAALHQSQTAAVKDSFTKSVLKTTFSLTNIVLAHLAIVSASGTAAAAGRHRCHFHLSQKGKLENWTVVFSTLEEMV